MLDQNAVVVKCPKCQKELTYESTIGPDGIRHEAIPYDGSIGLCHFCGNVFAIQISARQATEGDLAKLPEHMLVGLTAARNRILGKPESSAPASGTVFDARSICSADGNPTDNIPNN